MVNADPGAVPVRCSGLTEQARGDQLLLYLQDQQSFLLNRSARAVWDLCDGLRTVGDISALLEKESDMADGSLSEDVATTVKSLVNAGTLTVTEPVRVFIGSDPRHYKAELNR